MNEIILFFIRRKLKVKLFERFVFVNQKTRCVYYVGRTGIFKVFPDGDTLQSHVSLNWLLSPDCEIVKVPDVAW